MPIKRWIPHPVKQALKHRISDWRFNRAFAAFRRAPRLALSNRDLLGELRRGWGNEGWAADTEYLEVVLERALALRGPVLECGSGLSTLLVGAIAEHEGMELWTLEHHPGWFDCVRKQLNRYALRSTRLILAPIEDYGEFSWYRPPLEDMPGRFTLVICDGPPGDTPGGRYGLLPVMRERLSATAEILLDDTSRPAEARIARRWGQESGATVTFLGRDNGFASIKLGG
ncbi:MAG: class I SAM-dependent methyltransferase [Nitrococcus mobilis]|nr:class I SAM-dependent methyltransferase [Nitrococcus mobilis]